MKSFTIEETSEAVSAVNSMAEIKGQPGVGLSPASQLPEPTSVEELGDGQPVETNDLIESRPPDKVAELSESFEVRPQNQTARQSESTTLPSGDSGGQIHVVGNRHGKRSKPISEVKLAANRRNAGFSTGPKTQRGKRFSRRNAITSGIFVSEALLEGEDRVRLQELQQAVFRDCAPVGAVEEMLVADIALCYWRSERALRCEQGSALMEQADRMPGGELPEQERQAFKALVSVPFGENLNRILRYAPTFHRQLLANIAALERLQKARKAKEKEEET